MMKNIKYLVIGLILGMGIMLGVKNITEVTEVTSTSSSSAKQEEKIKISNIEKSGSKTTVNFTDGSYAIHDDIKYIYMFQHSQLGDWDLSVENSTDLEKVIKTFLNIEKEVENPLNTDEAISNYIKEFVKEEFNMEINLPIYFTDKLPAKTNAVITYGEKIEVNSRLKTTNSDYVEKVLIHEACHYYLEKVGSTQRGDGMLEFEKLLANYGSLSNLDYESLENFEEEINYQPFESRLSSLSIK